MFIIRKIYSFFIDTIQSLLLAAAVFLVVYVFLFRPFQVTGASMYPNFVDKQYVLTNIFILYFQKPRLGEVIVFKAPNDPEKDFIKRAIGAPGDRVAIRNNTVYLNGRQLDESLYIKNGVQTYPGSFLKENQEITVPKDSYFVLGDNRPHSSDSREWGFVPVNSIIGKSFFAYWPLDTMGFVVNPYR